MVHLFRAEISRANTWRQRLDATTNWAVVTTGAAVSFAFGANGHHTVIILNTLLVTLFLWIEARRDRYYELWAYRVRLMETDFFAPMLVPPFRPSADWAESLAESLLFPSFTVSMLEAIGRRLRRNYLWIYAILGAAWLLHVGLYPEPATSLDSFLDKGTVGPVDGSWVLLFGFLFNGALAVIALVTVGLQAGAGEVLPRYGGLPSLGRMSATSGERRAAGVRAWFRPSRRRAQVLTFTITDRPQKIAERVMGEMKRGVTSMAGTGMYSGEQHSVLMCALSVSEVAQLEAMVEEEDPSAFVIVSPAQEVRGLGFVPLEND
jgi:uncharacterized membrane protein